MHLLLHTGEDITYFLLPRIGQAPSAVGPKGIPMVNLVSGSFGIIDSVTILPGCPEEIACRRLAAPVFCSAQEVLGFARKDVDRVWGGLPSAFLRLVSHGHGADAALMVQSTCSTSATGGAPMHAMSPLGTPSGDGHRHPTVMGDHPTL